MGENLAAASQVPMMRQARSARYWKMRVVAVLLATGLALLASELALRVIWHNPYRMEHPDHVLKLRIHHPNTDHLLDRARTNHLTQLHQELLARTLLGPAAIRNPDKNRLQGEDLSGRSAKNPQYVPLFNCH